LPTNWPHFCHWCSWASIVENGATENQLLVDKCISVTHWPGWDVPPKLDLLGCPYPRNPVSFIGKPT